jgi:hypothetical protein
MRRVRDFLLPLGGVVLASVIVVVSFSNFSDVWCISFCLPHMRKNKYALRAVEILHLAKLHAREVHSKNQSLQNNPKRPILTSQYVAGKEASMDGESEASKASAAGRGVHWNEENLEKVRILCSEHRVTKNAHPKRF